MQWWKRTLVGAAFGAISGSVLGMPVMWFLDAAHPPQGFWPIRFSFEFITVIGAMYGAILGVATGCVAGLINGQPMRGTLAGVLVCTVVAIILTARGGDIDILSFVSYALMCATIGAITARIIKRMSQRSLYKEQS